MSMKKILNEGTFDPPHWGHIRSAIFAREKIGADEVIFIPNAHPEIEPWHPVLSFYRVSFLNIYLYEHGDDSMYVETEEAMHDGVSLTVDVLRRCLERHEGEDVEWYFLMGEDKMMPACSWQRCNEISDFMATAIVLCCTECGRGSQFWRNHMMPCRFSDKTRCIFKQPILMDHELCMHTSCEQLRAILADHDLTNPLLDKMFHKDVLSSIIRHHLYV